jgi:hypothetical protein
MRSRVVEARGLKNPPVEPVHVEDPGIEVRFGKSENLGDADLGNRLVIICMSNIWHAG